ncbi:stage III sporulation protein AG [Natranaerovirga pectinivora]|uniref:Stage III sporulation protein AG n=1 Tax=Natranaerovirga pectinivora TaxID=682400 RepID=A0A4R3MNS8_9FIRM|nr:stage III sporulation protein AG [Natranaerovirga pectinivora]TCT16917.1 stage III sporulation protein AG [Natranaerovirga pectinivora]
MSKLIDEKKLSLKKIGVEKLIFLLIIGVFLLIVSKPMFDDDITQPSQENDYIPPTTTVKAYEKTYEEEMEEKLKAVLSKIDGVGKVDVIITVKSSKELVVNKDNPQTFSQIEEKDGQGGERISIERSNQEATILTNSRDGVNVPFVVKELEPEVNGVVIVAEGGDSPRVKTDLINAAEVLFNIPSHRIKVMKMVSN